MRIASEDSNDGNIGGIFPIFVSTSPNAIIHIEAPEAAEISVFIILVLDTNAAKTK